MAQKAVSGNVELDPVRKIKVRNENKIISNCKGNEYRFCSEYCRKAFELGP
ncbi:MAG: YHS domain-containing protein [Dehalococcoidia bacterium]|jgi:YHS domain-containing protein